MSVNVKRYQKEIVLFGEVSLSDLSELIVLFEKEKRINMYSMECDRYSNESRRGRGRREYEERDHALYRGTAHARDGLGRDPAQQPSEEFKDSITIVLMETRLLSLTGRINELFNEILDKYSQVVQYTIVNFGSNEIKSTGRLSVSSTGSDK